MKYVVKTVYTCPEGAAWSASREPEWAAWAAVRAAPEPEWAAWSDHLADVVKVLKAADERVEQRKKVTND